MGSKWEIARDMNLLLHPLMWSDNVLCFICAPVAQCWSVTMYWLLQTDFINIVRRSCSSSAI